MPCPAVREWRWLAPSVCTPKLLSSELLPSPPSSAHPAGAIWPHTYSAQPCQDSLLLLQGSLQHPSWDNSLAWVRFWCYGLYVFPKFSCRDFELFPPNFPSPVPRLLLNFIPLIPGLSLTALLTIRYSHPISTCSPGRGPPIFLVEGSEPDLNFLI